VPEKNLNVIIPEQLIAKGGIGKVTVGDFELDVSVKKGTTNRLAFLFHGAVDRAVRKLPFFQPFMPQNPELTQISIADTTLRYADTLAPAGIVGIRNPPCKTSYPE